MTDHLSSASRSRLMSSVRSKNTSPEIILRSGLHSLGLRFRLHVKGMPGTPDLVFPKYKTVVFVHGCFWHRHRQCGRAGQPKSNIEFWQKKFLGNVERDAKNKADLIALGWNVIYVWECDIRSANKAQETIRRVVTEIKNNLR